MARSWSLVQMIAIAIALFVLFFYAYSKMIRPRLFSMSNGDPDQDPDERVFQVLRENGDELADPRETVFVILFQTETDLDSATDSIEKMGYKIRTLEPEPDEESCLWTCECVVSIVPEIEDVRQRMRTLGVIAAQFNGVVDGWDTLVINNP